MQSESNMLEEPSTVPQMSAKGLVRRVGRVERWLKKGFGFIIDIGEVVCDDTSYGWKKDQMTGSKIFVYHNALVTQSDQVFHRLFSFEYVEYSIDTSRPTRDGRPQAFNVTGLQRQLLLCDLNATNEDDDVDASGTTGAAAVKKHHQPPQVPGIPSGATVVYYMPPPQQPHLTHKYHQQLQPQQHHQQISEPKYLTPISGIPVPK